LILCYRESNNVHNAIRILQNVIVPEAQHTIACSMKPSVTPYVVLAAMLPAVHFDDQPALVADKISDERAYRHLSAEFSPGQPRRSQQQPKPVLRNCRLTPHFARETTLTICNRSMVRHEAEPLTRLSATRFATLSLKGRG
jgi:hypothetical protein